MPAMQWALVPYKKPMPAHIESVVFVYQQTGKPYRTKCVYYDDPIPGKGWVHTGTIQPAAWIERLLNRPEQRQKQIEELSV